MLGSRILRGKCAVITETGGEVKGAIIPADRLLETCLSEKNPPTHPEEGHGRLGNEAAGPSVLVLFPSRATLGIPIIPNFLVWVSECVSG